MSQHKNYPKTSKILFDEILIYFVVFDICTQYSVYHTWGKLYLLLSDKDLVYTKESTKIKFQTNE